MTDQAATSNGSTPKLVLVSDSELLTGSRAGKREVWRWAGPDDPPAPGHFQGDPTEAATFEWVRDAQAVTAVIDVQEPGQAQAIARALRTVRDDAAVLILSSAIEDAPGDGTLARAGALRDVLRIDLEDELRRLEAERRVYCLRCFADGAETVPILIHPDPDPDALSSAFAVRVLLGRSAEDTPIITTNAMTRPENRRMAQLLGARIGEVTAGELEALERLIVVDMQPTALCKPGGPRLAVIDHHPIEPSCMTEFHDVRPHIGATATMMTQYLRALDERRINEALATALLYGIKTDTDGLMRHVTEEDVDAYAFLQERANPQMLTRFERPAYPLEAARAFGSALNGLQRADDIVVADVGSLSEEGSHILADLGDFCIGIENVCWAAACGFVGEDFVMTLRHVGAEPGAGELARRIAEGRGSGGGHATMARVTISGSSAREWLGTEDDMAAAVLERLQEALADIDGAQSSMVSPSSSGPRPCNNESMTSRA